MDPFTATSLAGNILQFLQFAKGVYIQAREIQKSASGLTKKNEGTIWSLSDLHNLLDPIVSGTQAVGSSSTTSEQRIREIGQRCQDLSKELSNDIQGITVQDGATIVRVAKTVWRGILKKSEIDDKIKSLDALQDRLFKHLLAHISNQQHGVTGAIMDLIEENQKLEAGRTAELEQLKNQIQTAVSSIGDIDLAKQTRLELDAKFDTLRGVLASLQDRALHIGREQRILDSLNFPKMYHCRDEIPNQHLNTFQWALDEKLPFKRWLTADNGVFWVSGNPGSGKSTLMNYLSSQEDVDEILATWAEPKKLVKASYYFWYSGSTLQRSQEGLLRSLLFEILRQLPSSIPDVCPRRWNETIGYPWDRKELMDTLNRLSVHSSSVRFCFFIDGLDEYRDLAGVGRTRGQGSFKEVEEIIEVIQYLASLDFIKICISSRPWVPFERTFGKSSDLKLYVHEENRGDIRRYIRDTLENSEVFIESQLDKQELQYLINDVVDNSCGVFLWVFLVVQSLLRGLANQDRPSELRRRLSQLPTTLNGYFERMLNSVEDIYQEQTACILQTAFHAEEPLYVITYSFIGDEDAIALEREARAWDKEECIDMSRTAAVRLKVRCPDLLRVGFTTVKEFPQSAQSMTMHQVDFLHRTVRDFLALDDTQRLLEEKMTQPFDANKFICLSLLAQLKGCYIQRHPEAWSSGMLQTGKPTGMLQLLDDLTFYTRKMEIDVQKPQTAILDETKRVLEEIAGTSAIFEGDSFMSYAVQKDLRLYVRDKACEPIDECGTPLLDRALRPRIYSRYPLSSAPSPEMVSLLLEHGAKPGQMVSPETKSVWELYLKHIHQLHKTRGALHGEENHIMTIQSLLRYDADPSAQCIVGGTGSRQTVGKAEGLNYPIYANVLGLVQEIFPNSKTHHIRFLIEEKSKRRLTAGCVMS